MTSASHHESDAGPSVPACLVETVPDVRRARRAAEQAAGTPSESRAVTALNDARSVARLRLEYIRQWASRRPRPQQEKTTP